MISEEVEVEHKGTRYIVLFVDGRPQRVTAIVQRAGYKSYTRLSWERDHQWLSDPGQNLLMVIGKASILRG